MDVTGHDHAHIVIITIIIVPQKIDPGRKRRDVHNIATNNTINTFDDSADSMMLVGRVHVYSPDDLLADNFNQTATDVLDPLQAFTMGNNKTTIVMIMMTTVVVVVAIISTTHNTTGDIVGAAQVVDNIIDIIILSLNEEIKTLSSLYIEID